MHPPEAIVISALSRGGSNLLWNILQSHPRVCSPIRETGELFCEEILPFRLFDARAARRLAARPVVRRLGRDPLRRSFHRWKMRNYRSPENGESAEGVPYGAEEVARAIPCFKSVDEDLALNDLLDAVYGDVAHVALVRNGYAVCDGWMRRGIPARRAGQRYADFVGRMLARRGRDDRFALVKFEEMMRDPFGTAERLFRAFGLEPPTLPKIRLKAKRVLQASGRHETRFGAEGQKRWFGPGEVGKVLDAEIDDRQGARLDPAAREAFEAEARGALEALGYLGAPA